MQAIRIFQHTRTRFKLRTQIMIANLSEEPNLRAFEQIETCRK